MCDEQETCLGTASGGITCEHRECNPVADIAHGTIYGSNNLKVESKVLYKCDRQINNVNNDVIRTCQSNGRWSGSTPVCPLPECPMLNNIQNGEVHGIEQRTIGSEVTYACIGKYKIKRGDERRTCLEDQTWSGMQPTCLQYEFVFPLHSGHPTYTEYDMFANDISFEKTDVIVFKVKANNDAHIRLQIYRDNVESPYILQVILGGWGNQRSVIRGESISLDQHDENGIVNRNTFRSFWLKSSYTCIEVGKGLDSNAGTAFLEYCEVTTKHKYLSIGVGYNSAATFTFQ